MDFFISSAWAQAADPAPTGGTLGAFLPLIIIFAVFYFLLIRPQNKRAKEHREMVAALKEGDEVMIGGGVLGKIKTVAEQFVDVEVANGVVLKVQRASVSQVLPKGTFTSA